MPGRRETISEYAHQVLGEGDDLHMTDSFEANEENSSTIGNASCAVSTASPRSTTFRPKRQQYTQQVTIKKVESLDSSDNGIDSEQDGISLAPNQNPIAMRMPLKVINKFLHSIRERNSLLPWRIRRPNVNVTVLRPPPSLNSMREYQEMDEEEEEKTQAADSVTLLSLRSSRNNVGTGRTMLLRQNAQVFGRPSQAEAKWDISSSLSSSGTSNERSLQRQRSVTLDNASCSGLSDITEDTAFHRIKRIEPSLLRRHIVFARPADAHFGDTFCIEEVEESGSDGDETIKSRLASRYDFRQLQVIDESDPWNLYSISDIHDDLKSSRQRVFSDSDVVFELHRQHSWSDFDGTTPSPSSISGASRVLSSSDNSSKAFEQSQGTIQSYNRRSLENSKIAAKKNPVAKNRLRTHSDSFIPEAMTFSSHNRTFWDESDKVQNDKNNVFDETDSPNGFQFDFEERDEISDPRSRALSDTFRESIEQSQNMTARNRTHSLEEERFCTLKEEFNASFKSQARRLSNALLNQSHKGQHTNSTGDESLFAAISSSSSTGETNDRVGTGAPEDEVTTELMKAKLSSPHTLNAASAIVAALRPTPVVPKASLPTPPAMATISNQDYYWGDGVDDEVLWPSISSSDSLEDLF